jgi:hypothetical protein
MQELKSRQPRKNNEFCALALPGRLITSQIHWSALFQEPAGGEKQSLFFFIIVPKAAI